MADYSKIEVVDKNSPQPEIINKAVEIVKNDGVIVFPTWCFYGLGCDAFNEKAISKVFDIKRRPSDKPLLILIPDNFDLLSIVKEIPETAQRVMDRFWPGRITIVFEAEENIPEILTSGTGKIGVRLPENRVAKAVVNRLGTPLTGTSANISNEPGCFNISEMSQSVIDESDLTLDSGELKGGKGSTIIDVTKTPPEIIREGEIDSESIYHIL